MSFRVQDPLTLFSQWLEEAAATEVNDPNAMALATADGDGTLTEDKQFTAMVEVIYQLGGF